MGSGGGEVWVMLADAKSNMIPVSPNECGT